MRFLHTADWQIGMRAASAGRAGERVREARLVSAASLMRSAEADFALIAGDTFEDNAVAGALVQRTAEIAASFRGPVFVLPGNHDPLLPASVWQHPAWRQFGNIQVIDREGIYPVPGGHLLAAPLRERHSKLDPTLWMSSAERPEGITIGMSHGTVAGIPAPTEHHPIAADAALRGRVDYLALGHWHSTLRYPNRMAYCGTHETTSFGERDSGNALMVAIDAPGAAPRVEVVATGRLNWRAWERTMRSSADLVVLRDEVAALPDDVLLRITLDGFLFAGQAELLAQLDDIGHRFLFFEMRRQNLLPETGGDWFAQWPEGAVLIAAKRLRLAASQGDKAAAVALLELQLIARQADA